MDFRRRARSLGTMTCLTAQAVHVCAVDPCGARHHQRFVAGWPTLVGSRAVPLRALAKTCAFESDAEMCQPAWTDDWCDGRIFTNIGPGELLHKADRIKRG